MAEIYLPAQFQYESNSKLKTEYRCSICEHGIKDADTCVLPLCCDELYHKTCYMSNTRQLVISSAVPEKHYSRRCPICQKDLLLFISQNSEYFCSISTTVRIALRNNEGKVNEILASEVIDTIVDDCSVMDKDGLKPFPKSPWCAHRSLYKTFLTKPKREEVVKSDAAESLPDSQSDLEFQDKIRLKRKYFLIWHDQYRELRQLEKYIRRQSKEKTVIILRPQFVMPTVHLYKSNGSQETEIELCPICKQMLVQGDVYVNLICCVNLCHKMCYVSRGEEYIRKTELSATDDLVKCPICLTNMKEFMAGEYVQGMVKRMTLWLQQGNIKTLLEPKSIDNLIHDEVIEVQTVYKQFLTRNARFNPTKCRLQIDSNNADPIQSEDHTDIEWRTLLRKQKLVLKRQHFIKLHEKYLDIIKLQKKMKDIYDNEEELDAAKNAIEVDRILELKDRPYSKKFIYDEKLKMELSQVAVFGSIEPLKRIWPEEEICIKCPICSMVIEHGTISAIALCCKNVCHEICFKAWSTHLVNKGAISDTDERIKCPACLKNIKQILPKLEAYCDEIENTMEDVFQEEDIDDLMRAVDIKNSARDKIHLINYFKLSKMRQVDLQLIPTSNNPDADWEIFNLASLGANEVEKELYGKIPVMERQDTIKEYIAKLTFLYKKILERRDYLRMYERRINDAKLRVERTVQSNKADASQEESSMPILASIANQIRSVCLSVYDYATTS